MGHAEGGESFGGGCTLLEEVFPIVIECWEWEKWYRESRIIELPGRGLAAESTESYIEHRE